jgi:uncharacterized protein (DUF433 family)
LILDFLASGMSAEEILEEYPDLVMEDIFAAIAPMVQKCHESVMFKYLSRLHREV